MTPKTSTERNRAYRARLRGQRGAELTLRLNPEQTKAVDALRLTKSRQALILDLIETYAARVKIRTALKINRGKPK